MSPENVEILKRLYERWGDAFGPLDDETLTTFLDPGIEWDVSRRYFDPGVYHGYAGIREFVTRLREVWQSGRVEPLEFIPTGDQVVVPVHLEFVSNTHGQTMTVTANAAHVWTLRAGKILRHTVFQTKSEALAAVGLSE